MVEIEAEGKDLPTMTGWVRRAFLLSLLVSAIVACSAQSSASTSPSAVSPSNPPSSFVTTPSALAAELDPCQLVSKEEAEQLAGTSLNPGVLIKGESPTCTYSGPVTGPLAQVEIYVGDGAKKILDIDQELHHTLTAVRGIGDEAYEEDGAIFLRKSDRWVAVRLVLLKDPKLSRQPLERLARIVASRF